MLDFIEKIKGEIPDEDSTDEGEKWLLYGFVRALKPEVCVEVGSHRAMTSLWLAKGLEDNEKGHLYTVDPFEWGQRGNIRKFPELEKRITFDLIKGEELDVKDIDFLFLDGFHEYAVVMDEIKHFLPRLSDKAVVVFHDCGGDTIDAEPGADTVGVNRAIEDSGLKAVLIPTFHRVQIYSNFEL